jgi:hypothetical protein
MYPTERSPEPWDSSRPNATLSLHRGFALACAAKTPGRSMETRAFLRTPDRSIPNGFEISKFWGSHSRVLAAQVCDMCACVWRVGRNVAHVIYAPTLQASTAPLYISCNGGSTGGVVLRASRTHPPICTGDRLVIVSTRRDGNCLQMSHSMAAIGGAGAHQLQSLLSAGAVFSRWGREGCRCLALRRIC